MSVKREIRQVGDARFDLSAKTSCENKAIGENERRLNEGS